MDVKEKPSQAQPSGQTVFEPQMSTIPLDSIGPYAHSPQPGDPGDPYSTPYATTNAMDYARASQPQLSRRIDYQVPFGDGPVPIQCPRCHQRTTSKIHHVSGGYTFAWALGLCAITGLGCIPFCVGRLKNVEHYCENCEQKLATWHRHDGRVDAHI